MHVVSNQNKISVTAEQNKQESCLMWLKQIKHQYVMILQ